MDQEVPLPEQEVPVANNETTDHEANIEPKHEASNDDDNVEDYLDEDEDDYDDLDSEFDSEFDSDYPYDGYGMDDDLYFNIYCHCYNNFNLYKPYSEKEVFNLLDGFSKYGANFERILEMYEFYISRTPYKLEKKFEQIELKHPDWRDHLLKKLKDEQYVMFSNKPKKKSPPKVFTKGEIKQILNGVSRHGVRNWAFNLIYNEYRWASERSPGQIRKKYLQIKDDKISLLPEDDDDEPYRRVTPNPKAFTQQEIENLKDGVHLYHKGNWSLILDQFKFKEGRTEKSLAHKYYRMKEEKEYEQEKSKAKRQAFSREEIQSIKEGVEKFGTQWTKIVKHYPFKKGRTPTSIQNKYYQMQTKEKRKRPKEFKMSVFKLNDETQTLKKVKLE